MNDRQAFFVAELADERQRNGNSGVTLSRDGVSPTGFLVQMTGEWNAFDDGNTRSERLVTNFNGFTFRSASGDNRNAFARLVFQCNSEVNRVHDHDR